MARARSQTTTDHETIRRWVEERGGWPAEVTSTARGTDDTGIIRIDFPGYAGEGTLNRIDWEEWFQKFDQSGLAFVYQDTTAGGERSNFNKLVARETAAARAEGKRTARPTGATRARGKPGAARGARTSTRGARKPAGGAARGSQRGVAKKKTGTSGRRGAAGAAAARTVGGRGGRTGARTGTRAAGSRAGGRIRSAGGRSGTTGRKGGARSSRRSSR